MRWLTLPIGADQAGETRVHPPPAGAGALRRRGAPGQGAAGGILLDGAPSLPTRWPGRPGPRSGRGGSLPAAEQIAPVPGPLTIVYEDQDLVILDKAGGVPVHPSQGHHGDTLANFLLAHYRDQGLTAAFHPVHRLDRGTSGLMAVAKHPHAHEGLQHQLQEGTLRRAYLAVCEGVPVPGGGAWRPPLPGPGVGAETGGEPPGGPGQDPL